MLSLMEVFLLFSESLIMICDVAGRMSGLKESDRGQTGVMIMHRTNGCAIEPPAESEYAVEPVGVAKVSPSPVVVVRKVLSMKISNDIKFG